MQRTNLFSAGAAAPAAAPAPVAAASSSAAPNPPVMQLTPIETQVQQLTAQSNFLELRRLLTVQTPDALAALLIGPIGAPNGNYTDCVLTLAVQTGNSGFIREVLNLYNEYTIRLKEIFKAREEYIYLLALNRESVEILSKQFGWQLDFYQAQALSAVQRGDLYALIKSHDAGAALDYVYDGRSLKQYAEALRPEQATPILQYMESQGAFLPAPDRQGLQIAPIPQQGELLPVDAAVVQTPVLSHDEMRRAQLHQAIDTRRANLEWQRQDLLAAQMAAQEENLARQREISEHGLFMQQQQHMATAALLEHVARQQAIVAEMEHARANETTAFLAQVDYQMQRINEVATKAHADIARGRAQPINYTQNFYTHYYQPAAAQGRPPRPPSQQHKIRGPGQ